MSENVYPAPQGAPTIDLNDLRTSGETVLRTVCLILTILTVLLCVVLGKAIVILLVFVLGLMLMSYIMLACIISDIRANGIKVGPDQLPDIHASVCRVSRTLGLDKVPEVYVVQAGGMLNAFATRFAFRRWVVFYSELVDACGDDTRELDMVMAHEVGHLALGHIMWMWLLLPARLVPFLGMAYSRACEYSADRCGQAGCGSGEAAYRGLLILAARGRYGREANIGAFIRQRDRCRGFWQTVIEWFSTHPWLTRRVEALAQFGRAWAAPPPVPTAPPHVPAAPPPVPVAPPPVPTEALPIEIDDDSAEGV